MLLELFTSQDGFRYKWDELSIEIAAGDFDLSTESLIEIVNYLVLLELVQIKDGFIFSGKQIERFSGLLAKRTRDSRRYEAQKGAETDIKSISASENGQQNHVSASENPQSKVKESKYNSPESSDPEPGENGQTQNHIPYQGIIETWNNTLCPPLSKVTKITDSRKKKIKVRFAEMGGSEKVLETLNQLFGKIKTSSFLLGDGPRGWKVDFDWVFENDSNWVKIMEGNYSGSPVNTKPQQVGPIKQKVGFETNW